MLKSQTHFMKKWLNLIHLTNNIENFPRFSLEINLTLNIFWIIDPIPILWVWNFEQWLSTEKKEEGGKGGISIQSFWAGKYNSIFWYLFNWAWAGDVIYLKDIFFWAYRTLNWFLLPLNFNIKFTDTESEVGFIDFVNKCHF